jgi:3-deoxy-D-manno-octulosonic-acid transferase
MKPRPGAAILLALYRLLWCLALPLVLLYFRRRARRDPAYGLHMEERWGRGPVLEGAVWVHAVSLGEMRSAVPLVRALIDRGERVVTTHLTPAGRRASEAAFADEIAQGRLLARYLPFELAPAYRRFLAAMKPRAALALEVEIWPVMIAEARRAGVPLFLVNSQVPGRSWHRARRLARFAGHPVAGVTAVFAKSRRHAERFRSLGAPAVEVTGELRFDQPVPAPQLAAAAAVKALIGRPVLTVASVVEGEDALYLDAYRRIAEAARAAGTPVPLFVHVPRAPERFEAAAAELARGGVRVVRRSTAFDRALSCSESGALVRADVLLGDSLGEMHFYLGLADVAVVGGGFLPSGAHNMIEPLAHGLPVLSGPYIWTIEYPAEEAVADGVLQICADPRELAVAATGLLADPAARAEAEGRAQAFLTAHAGATDRTLRLLASVLDPLPNPVPGLSRAPGAPVPSPR